MRLIKALMAFVFVALGVVFAALNRQPVHTDLGLVTLDASLGLSLLAALLLGALLGGAVAMIGSLAPKSGPTQKTANNAGPASPDV